MEKFLALSLSDVVFIMLINVKMPTFVGILTLMSRINFVLSRVEHGKNVITSGPDLDQLLFYRVQNCEKLCPQGAYLVYSCLYVTFLHFFYCS